MKLRSIFEIAHETMFLLRRGPIFIPAIVFTLIICVFAAVASAWGVAEFRKILFDIGGFGFHFIGNLVAIIWSVKIIAIARLDGSLEVQLASPVSRTAWLIGRFIGIYLSLLIMGILMLIVWQGIMLITQFGLFTKEEFLAFCLQILGWGSTAALSLFFASFCGLITALFASFALWISGLLTELIAMTIRPDDVGNTLSSIFQTMSYVWNLQNFNRTPAYLFEHGLQTVAWGSAYGIVLILFFILCGTFTFSRSFE